MSMEGRVPSRSSQLPAASTRRLHAGPTEEHIFLCCRILRLLKYCMVYCAPKFHHPLTRTRIEYDRSWTTVSGRLPQDRRIDIQAHHRLLGLSMPSHKHTSLKCPRLRFVQQEAPSQIIVPLDSRTTC